MIVKIVSDIGEIFIYSDISDVAVRAMGRDELDADEYNKQWILGTIKTADVNVYKLLRFMKGEELSRRIVVDNGVKVYLMNDEGKTVERLN